MTVLFWSANDLTAASSTRRVRLRAARRSGARLLRKFERYFAGSHRRWSLLGQFWLRMGRFPTVDDLGESSIYALFHRWVEQRYTALEWRRAELAERERLQIMLSHRVP